MRRRARPSPAAGLLVALLLAGAAPAGADAPGASLRPEPRLSERSAPSPADAVRPPPRPASGAASAQPDRSGAARPGAAPPPARPAFVSPPPPPPPLPLPAAMPQAGAGAGLGDPAPAAGDAAAPDGEVRDEAGAAPSGADASGTESSGAGRAAAPGRPGTGLRPKARPPGIAGSARAATRTVAVQLPAVRAIPRPPARPARFERLVARVLEAQRREAQRQAAAPVAASAPAAVAPRRPERRGFLEGLLGRTAQPAPSARGSVCGNRAIRGRKIAPVPAERRGCGIAEPVRITEVSGVRLSTPATVDCPTALALNTWVETGAKPAIGRTGGGLAALQVAAHYACRTRNNRPGARVSEHGRGRAIDISALILANGQRITVLHGWRSRQNGPALRRMHAAACGPFGTVLGPAADRYHQDHFHFDTARYRSGAYCR